MKKRPPVQPRQVFWIPVGNHMPDDETTVLVYGQNEISLAWHEAGEWRDCGNAALLAEVSHWMDLPEPPNNSHAKPAKQKRRVV